MTPDPSKDTHSAFDEEAVVVVKYYSVTYLSIPMSDTYRATETDEFLYFDHEVDPDENGVLLVTDSADGQLIAAYGKDKWVRVRLLSRKARRR